MTKDIVESFWKKYLHSDSLERRDMLKKIVPTVSEVVSIEDKGLREKVLLTSLQGYFDDLICVMIKKGKKPAVVKKRKSCSNKEKVKNG